MLRMWMYVVNQPASLSPYLSLLSPVSCLLSTLATYLPTYLSPIQHRNEINGNERTNERPKEWDEIMERT